MLKANQLSWSVRADQDPHQEEMTKPALDILNLGEDNSRDLRFKGALSTLKALIRLARHRDTLGVGRRTRGEGEHSNIEKSAQLARMVRVLKFAERLGLDLPDSFAGYRELVSDFF